MLSFVRVAFVIKLSKTVWNSLCRPGSEFTEFCLPPPPQCWSERCAPDSKLQITNFNTTLSRFWACCINYAPIMAWVLNCTAVTPLKVMRTCSYPYAQLFPDPCLWQKHACWPYFHRPAWAALDRVWLIALGSMSTSTARATGTRVEKREK